MDNDHKKMHWENVYETKSPGEVSWTQEVPQTSLNFISSFVLNKQVRIIDIGGGDSKLVDHLLEQGFEHITVLDISEKALEKAKSRLGDKAKKVKWIVGDILDFKPEASYDVWHDRATFHFLTTPDQVSKYLDTVRNAVTGFVVLGTFSEQGPLKCSGLEVKQYNEQTLKSVFDPYFEKVFCVTENQTTPFDTQQNFLFCSFKKIH